MWLDDLDNTKEAVETVLFGIDGVSYEVDLCNANATKLRDCLEPFAQVARKAGTSIRPEGQQRPPRVMPTPDAAAKRQQLDAIRAWAKKKGYEVSDRGRIPITVREAFDKAHPGRVSVV